MTIMLTPETEAKLREKALREGTDVNAVAEALISSALENEEMDFQEAVIGIQKGLEASWQGRVRPAQEVLADLRMKLQSQNG
jgi:predicted transcriptional regulator